VGGEEYEPGKYLTDGRSFGLINDEEFYARMGEFHIRNWRGSATKCAAALRLYAEKYHKLDPGFVKLRGELNELAAVRELQELSETAYRHD
jgi:hypothetical protein